MSEELRPEAGGAQQQVQDSDGTLFGLMLALGGYLCFFVALLAAVGAVTGWKISMKGAAIPGKWWFSGVFVVLGMLSYGTGWVVDHPVVRSTFRNNKWLWFPLIGGISLSLWGLIFAINVSDAGGFMMYAVSKGNVAKVRSYLKDSKLTPETKIKMLQKAVYKKQTPVVQLLLEHGVDANALRPLWKNQKPNGYRLFYEACSSGELAMVKAFVDKGADVNSTDSEGRSPLYFAAVRNYRRRIPEQRKVVEYLLSKGARLKGKVERYYRLRIQRIFPRLSDKLLGNTDALGQPNIKVPAQLPTQRRAPGLSDEPKDTKKAGDVDGSNKAGDIDEDTDNKPKPRTRTKKKTNWMEE